MRSAVDGLVGFILAKLTLCRGGIQLLLLIQRAIIRSPRITETQKHTAPDRFLVTSLTGLAIYLIAGSAASRMGLGIMKRTLSSITVSSSTTVSPSFEMRSTSR